MEIGRPEFFQGDGQTGVRSMVESRLGRDWLWYSVPTSQADALFSDTADAFLMGLLPVGMALGEDIKVKAPISLTLLFNLNHGYLKILKAQMPQLRESAVLAEQAESLHSSRALVATGVSGGVDSSHAITEYHLSNQVPETLRVRQLVFFNVGSHGEPNRDTSRALFMRRMVHARRIAEMVGLPLLTVDSNLSEFHTHVNFTHNQTVTARNVSAAMSIQSRISRYLVASGPTWARSSYGPASSMEFSEPFSLPLSRTEHFQVIGVGGELTRAEKVERIAHEVFARKLLNPCVRDVKNCGRCFKCCSTQLPLEILGLLDRFDQVFDLDSWAKQRGRYIVKIKLARRKSPAMRDVRPFAKSHDFRLSAPLSAYAEFYLRDMKSRLVRALRRSG